MEDQTILSLLAGLRFSAELSTSALGRLAASATVRSYPAGTRLFREGETSEYLMIVSSGRVGLDMNVPGRGAVRVLSLEAGDLLAWSALLENARMTASALAVEDTEVVAVLALAVLQACDQDPEFGYQFMRRVVVALAERLLATRLQLLDLFADTTPQESPRSAGD